MTAEKKPENPPEAKTPFPSPTHDTRPIPSSGGEKSYREPGTRPFTVDLDKRDGKEQAPLQPNDRDEVAGGTQDSQKGGPREVMEQAYEDIMQGQKDTDLREQRGVEETVDEPLKPAKKMPQKHGRT